MDFNNLPFPLFFIFSFLIAIIGIIVAVIGRKSNFRPDYNNAIPVIEILKNLVKICPINSTTKWKLIPSDYGSSRCWMQKVFFPVIKNEINVCGSAILLNSSSASICSLIADVVKWSDWNPFYTSQYVIKSFHDKQLRRDHYMEAEQVVSIIRETNKIQPHTFLYRFHDFSENKVGWILFWDTKRWEFMFFLIQPVKNKNDNPVCLLTHIIGAESKYCSSSASLVSQRLRNIQDHLTVSPLSLVPSKLALNPPTVSEELVSKVKTQISSSNLQENYFSLSSIRARRREVRNTVFILVPFVSSSRIFSKQVIEFKLAVKNMDSAGSEKSQTPEQEHTLSSKNDFNTKRPIRRAMSDVVIKSTAFDDVSKDANSSDLGKNTFISYVKGLASESKDKISKFSRQNSDTTSEDSETKNKPVAASKKNYKSKLRSLSETVIHNTDDFEVSYDLRKNTENGCKLEDINENVEDKLVAMYEQDYKEMYNSSISDFEIVENTEFTENRIAGFMTQGNYGASELQAEVLLASHLEDDSGNYQFAGGWMLHCYYKGLNVLTKTTCSQFMKICSFLCQIELAVPPEDVWRFVKNPQFRFICDESVKSVEVLEKISNSQKLIHTYHEVTGFLKKELIDFCLLQTEREELNKFYSCFYSIEFDKCPFMNSVTRGTLRPSGWIVEKVDKDANRSRVTYMIQALVNSPDSMFIQELCNMVPQSVYNLKNYITSKPM